MKTLLVTSEITYVPNNYRDALDEVLKTAAPHIAGVVLVKVVSLRVLRQVAVLYLMGCTRTANTLSRNIIELPSKKTESLFQKYDLPVLRTRTMNDPKIMEWVRRNDIDLIVNMRARSVFKKEILRTPRFGCLNIHHGLLPEYRGMLCDLYALGDGRPAGFTIHVMSEAIDAGRILMRQEVSRGDKDYMRYLSKTGRHEGKALGELLNQIAQTDGLPKGMRNYVREPIFSKSPTKREIKILKSKNIAL